MNCKSNHVFNKKTDKIVWRSRRSFLAVLLALSLTPIIFFMMDRAEVIIEDLIETNRFIKKSQNHDAEQEKGITRVPEGIPRVFEDIARIPEDLPVLTCNGTDWVNCYKSECSIATAIQETVKEIVCIYQDIIYVNGRNVIINHPTKVIGDEKYTLNKSDIVKIDCTGKDMKSSDVSAHWSGYKAGFRPVPVKPMPDRRDSYNVLILCFESTTRNGFVRRMRNSYKYLTEQLNAVVLNNYNIVGNSTIAALYPILTGKSEKELMHINGSRRKKYIDSKKFIFHFLKEYGYRTAYFDNMHWVHGKYKFSRFQRPPADHYLRLSLLADIEQRENRSHSHLATSCFGDMPRHQLMMNLANEFIQLDGKKFCFTLVADEANENFTVLPTADESFLSFLQTLVARRAFEDTLILVMGDQQSRLSAMPEIFQDRLLERLQLMAILLPEKLKNRRPIALTSLKNNKDKLITPFDIHSTILDVLDVKKKNSKRKIPGIKHLRAMTLLEPIPKLRSFGDAGSRTE